MVEQFGVREFQFYDAFEGFSSPPAEHLTEWQCAIQGRPVQRSVVKAAIDEIRKLGGRAWLAVHAAATDPNDEALTEGQWVMSPEDVVKKLDTVYFEAAARRRRLSGMLGDVEQAQPVGQDYQVMCGCDVGIQGREDIDPRTRIMDVVDMNPAWAMRIVPRWARFAADIGFSGIHWDTLGDFGDYERSLGPMDPFSQRGVPRPDIPGFLRAALPIMREHGQLQTLNFVNGFGWDQSLLNVEVGNGWDQQSGRVIAFPYWEAWTSQKEQELLTTSGKASHGFVIAMYPGYSKYHCCIRNERQNSANYGVWPFDLGLRRWRRATEYGGTYHFIVDGDRYLQGPFVPDAVRFQSAEVREIQAMLKDKSWGDEAGRAVHIYASDDKGGVWRQPLHGLTNVSRWTLVSSAAGTVTRALALDSGRIYATTVDGKVVYQHLELVTPESKWKVIATGDVQSVAVSEDTMYAVSNGGGLLMRQDVADMRAGSLWQPFHSSTATEDVSSIYIRGDIIYAIDKDQQVVKQSLLTFRGDGWEKVSAPGVTSVAVIGDLIFGSGTNEKVVKQALSAMSVETAWQTVANGPVHYIAIQAQPEA